MHRSLARAAVALVLVVVGMAATASAALADPSVSVSPTANLTPAGKAVTVTGAEIPLTTGTPPGTGLYAAQFAIVDGTTYVAYNANAKFVSRTPSGSPNSAKLEDDGTFSTTVTVVQTFTSSATTVDCLAADTQCFVGSWPAHGNPSAGNVIDATAIEFADIAATPTTNLNPAGQSVAVTGTNLALSTGTPPGTGLYAAQLAIVDGTTYVANNANAKFVSRTPSGSPNSAKLEDDGTFSTTVDVVRTFTSGATTIDCRAADTQCFIASWPAHGNPSAASIIDSVPIAFTSIAATPTTDLDPAGQTVAVTGADIPLTTGTPPGTGLYAAQFAIVDGTTYVAYNANAKFVSRTPSGSPNSAMLEDDGTFSTTVDVVRSWGSGASAVDCSAADTQCFVGSWPAHGNPSAANVIDSVAITFASGGGGGGDGGGGSGAFGLAVSPASGLGTAGPSTVTVTGSGYSASEPGIYLVYGPLAGRADPGSYSGATQWLHVAGGNLSAAGSFTTTIAVEPMFTNGNGAVVNCTLVQCYVQTMRAHGQTDIDQDFAVPVSFGTTVATPPAEAPAAGTPSEPTGAPAAGSGPATGSPSTAAPKLAKPSIKGGRVSIDVTERSTITFVLRKKVKGKWKVVKVVRVKTTGAGVAGAKLPIGRAGKYRISIKAVSSETGKASQKVVKHLTVKAKKTKHG